MHNRDTLYEALHNNDYGFFSSKTHFVEELTKQCHRVSVDVYNFTKGKMSHPGRLRVLHMG